MYEYKFVTVEMTGLFSAKPKEDYKKIIDEHAKGGYRFVQVFAPGLSNNGLPLFFDLIFEREIH